MLLFLLGPIVGLTYSFLEATEDDYEDIATKLAFEMQLVVDEDEIGLGSLLEGVWERPLALHPLAAYC